MGAAGLNVGTKNIGLEPLLFPWWWWCWSSAAHPYWSPCSDISMTRSTATSTSIVSFFQLKNQIISLESESLIRKKHTHFVVHFSICYEYYILYYKCYKVEIFFQFWWKIFHYINVQAGNSEWEFVSDFFSSDIAVVKKTNAILGLRRTKNS